MKRIMTTVLSVAMLSALGACGSDGGGDNSVPFTTVQDIRPSTTVRFVSSSQELTATSDEGVVTDVVDLTGFGSGASARLTYNEVGHLTGLTARSAEGNGVTFTESEIEQPNDDTPFYTAEKEDGSAVGVAASARELSWSYQSFGGFIIGPSSSEPQVVVQTVGAVTLPSGMPMMGTSTYKGLSAGVYSDSSGDVFQTEANVDVNVDFADLMSIGFMTTGTMANELSSQEDFVAMSDLDMTGTLAYDAEENQFTGTVTTTGGKTVMANGLFYGPAAEEIGGTFATPQEGTGVEAYIGAFGAAEAEPSVPFTTVSDIQPSTTVLFEGSSQELTAMRADNVVTDVRNLMGFRSGASASFTYNEEFELIGVIARSAEGTEVTFTELEIEQPDEDTPFFTAVNEEQSAVGIAAAAGVLEWNYQSFGGWIIGPNSSEPQVVVQTVGAVTLPSGMPMMGTATYKGLSTGVYSNSDGDVFQTEADVGAVADFAGQSINFMTTGTMATELLSEDAMPTAMLDLDIRGTLGYEDGSNEFDGTVTAGGMTGTANGVFYGPAAEEIGGTFATRGTGVEAYIGGFGAAQQPAAE